MNLIINATCLAAKCNTGIERFALHICKELYRIDNTLKIISPTPILGLPVTGAPRILKSSQLWFGKNEYYVRALWDQTLFRSFIARQKPDVVFFPIQDGMFYPPVRQIVTVHDLHYLHFDEKVSECECEISAYRRLLFRLKMPHILKKSAAVIAVSEATKQDVVKTFGVNPDKIHVIYNGYDERRFHVSGDPLLVLERLGIAGEKYFLFVGSILRHKNIVRLVQAFATQNNGMMLVIAGACKDPEYLEEIRNAAAALGLQSDKVKYLEYVDDDDLPSLYRGATALVLPSLHEGFGVPIIEAMACGTPVITSNSSAMPEVAGGAALLVDPYSFESIAAAMREILDSPQGVYSLRKAGLERARMFRWSYSAQKLYDLCDMVSKA